MNTSIDNISFNISGDKPASSSFYQTGIELSQNNTSHIYSILSFGNLQENWDSYGAKKPIGAAITKAINFIYSQLSIAKQEAFFTAPTPDGDVLVEIKNAVSTLEFIFSAEADDKIIASCNGDFYAEEVLNETTFRSYLKWMYK